MERHESTAMLSATGPIAAPWQHERAEDRIRRTYDRFAAAWSRGDARLVASVLANDCDHVTLAGVGHVRRTRAELIDCWTKAFAERRADFSIRLNASLRSIRLLEDRLALVDGDLEYSRGVGPGGVRHLERAQPFTAVMTREDADWLILSIRVGAAARSTPHSPVMS